MVSLLRFPAKKLRAIAIKRYMGEAGYDKAVCFSCGNAVTALRSVGVETLGISPNGEYTANRWMTQAEIHRTFPLHFDATSGHLPQDLMLRVADSFKAYLGELDGDLYVPCGSGETLVCLGICYPNTRLHAVYNLDCATEYSDFAPLNPLVRRIAASVLDASRGEYHE